MTNYIATYRVGSAKVSIDVQSFSRTGASVAAMSAAREMEESTGLVHLLISVEAGFPL